MTHSDKQIGRIRLTIDDQGYRFGGGYAAQISCPTGWNDSCPIQTHTVSIEELRDLKHLIERALALAPDNLT